MRSTFEEACEIANPTLEEITTKGFKKAFTDRAEILKTTGWTISELCDEARERLLKTIEDTKNGH